MKKNKRYSEFFTYVHFDNTDENSEFETEETESLIKGWIEEQLEYNSEAEVTEDESGNSELLKYKIESDIIDWNYADEHGNRVKKEDSITEGGMYRVYFSRIIISDYQGGEYYLEDWCDDGDYFITSEGEE